MTKNSPPNDDDYRTRLPNARNRTSAGGVVCRYDRQSDQLFFAVVREIGEGFFVLPKGGVEKGESYPQAAVREIGEEAGIHQLEQLCKLGVCQRMGFSKINWVTTHFYLFVTDQIDFRPTDPEHTYTPEWWPWGKTDKMYWFDQREMVEAELTFIENTVRKHLSKD